LTASNARFCASRTRAPGGELLLVRLALRHPRARDVALVAVEAAAGVDSRSWSFSSFALDASAVRIGGCGSDERQVPRAGEAQAPFGRLHELADLAAGHARADVPKVRGDERRLRQLARTGASTPIVVGNSFASAQR
jgi:hypothetical protein